MIIAVPALFHGNKGTAVVGPPMVAVHSIGVLSFGDGRAHVLKEVED